MSALEQSPPTTESREVSRLLIAGRLSVLIGRADGLLIDLSERGARVRHATQILRGSEVRFSFQWQGQRFFASAEVLSSRVAALGEGARTVYESRLRFRLVTDTAQNVLQTFLATCAAEDVRRWVANLNGWNEDQEHGATAPALAGSSFLRCRLIGRRWELKKTTDCTQPPDGFVLHETVPAREVADLCQTYEESDPEGRKLIRRMAAAAISAE